MKTTALKADLLLLLTATLWGFAFVAQRVGMDHIGPFAYNGIRFALGSLSLVPLITYLDRKNGIHSVHPAHDPSWKAAWKAGLLAGLALFAGASLQQAGLVFTTAGKAGFITGLYVVIVPLLGLFWKQRPPLGTWAGAVLAAVGLYFLSVTEELTMEFGDVLVLAGAFFWAGHVLLLGWMSPRLDPVKLACCQFAVCSVLSLATSMVFEETTLQGIRDATVPILYGGLVSVGIAYTLQVVAQKDAHPAHAAILLSMESAFAALGGWIILSERLELRGLVGCALMLSGMILSQLAEYLPQGEAPGAAERGEVSHG
ncbi:Permease of the drug/metabolite transporter (DMT) superfamily [Desulfacinum hydrothermale DSM 13146]|uniref:Permease of the drug/metabolite transporter (DMT) superfamily n=1 Tax=Desulfacinum hydrothermale DSM 13146 TaxID=1121390 RepID=A0A1W1X2T8_9BACT|nr:DMT family transporter [Desulfacinum hydrothermale]SMC18217.1 Permease of the drug/metabolite transporter (DMT) superfamily [Desulfacinum hydrothermale DSM 13146]